MKIESIGLVFENCDSVKLMPDMFTSLVIDKITHAYWINCFQYRNGETTDYLSCERFHIFINKKGCAAKIRHDKKMMLRERLTRWQDITHVVVVFSETDQKDISVPWNHQSNCDTNDRQKMTKEDGGLLIVIE